MEIMMKKLVITLAITFFSAISVSAETIIGVALSEFSTEKPSSTFTVKLQENFSIDNMESYQAGTVFYGKVTKVVNGQIGKRKGYFEFTPTHYATADGVYEFNRNNMNVRVKYYKPFDKSSASNLAQTGVTTAASMVFHVPLLSQGVSFVKGVVNPEEDTNRVVSGFKKVYKDSPVSYVEKGEELYLKVGQEVKLKIGENEED